MKHKIYTVYEYFPGENGDDKRQIFTFDNRASAVELLTFLHERDYNLTAMGVEEHEVTT